MFLGLNWRQAWPSRLTETLLAEYNPGSEVKPQLPEMKLSAMDLARPAEDSTEAYDFLGKECELKGRKEASLYADVITRLEKCFSLDSKSKAKTMAGKLGIKGDSYGRKYIAAIAKDGAILGLKLRPEGNGIFGAAA